MVMKPTRKLLWTTAAVLALIVILTVVARARGRRELERYRAELIRKGERLRFEDFLLSRDPDPQNTFGQFTNAVGRLTTKRFEPGELEVMRITTPGRVSVSWAANELTLSANARRALQTVSWAEVREQCSDNRATLEEIRLRLQAPPYSITTDRTNLYDGRIANFVAKRRAAQHLTADAILALHESDTTRARADLLALLQLVKLHRDEPSLVSAMIRVAVGGLALSATGEALAYPHWSAGDLEVLAEAWQQVDFIQIGNQGFAGERMGLVELCQSIRTEGGHHLTGVLNPTSGNLEFAERMKSVPTSLFFRLTLENNELFILRHMQRTIEAQRRLSQSVAWVQVQAELQTNFTSLQSLMSGPSRWRYALAAIALPNLSKAHEVCVQRETERRLLVTAIALRRFERAHARLPSQLDELLPEFLPSMPADPMSGQPIKYRLRPDGGYLLYSVGEDGQDDGGDLTSRGGRGIWGTRDAVWPAFHVEP